MQLLIAENEPLLARQLAKKLQEVWPEATHIQIVYNGLAAIEAIELNHISVAFLDVRMPGLSGLDVARLCGGRCHIVFVTAYDEYAVSAFEIDAIDYVVKPVQSSRLAQTVERLKKKLAQKPLNLSLQLQAQQLPEYDRYLSKLNAKLGNTTYLIDVNDILYFQSCDKYTEVVTLDRKPLINVTLKELELQLNPKHFSRIRNSTIVNLDSIESIIAKGRDKLTLKLKKLDEVLLVSRVYNQRFKEKMREMALK